MNEMNITSAQYFANEVSGINTSIQATIDGITISVPLDPENRHYAEIMRRVADGDLTITDAE